MAAALFAAVALCLPPATMVMLDLQSVWMNLLAGVSASTSAMAQASADGMDFTCEGGTALTAATSSPKGDTATAPTPNLAAPSVAVRH